MLRFTGRAPLGSLTGVIGVRPLDLEDGRADWGGDPSRPLSITARGGRADWRRSARVPPHDVAAWHLDAVGESRGAGCSRSRQMAAMCRALFAARSPPRLTR